MGGKKSGGVHGGSAWVGSRPPSGERMAAVMRGEMTLAKLGPAERSNIRLMIYHKACDVLTFENTDAIKREIERQPETIREAVRVEARRIYKLRGL